MFRKLLIIAAFAAIVCSPGSALAGGSQPKVGCKYPIVLAHGFSGFDSLLGIEYFYGIASALKAEGHKVFATEVSAFNSAEVRGNQLADQVEQILAITGAQKVILLGHSMGGLDVRYAAKYRLGANKVAAVVTLASPHRGAVIADLTYAILNGAMTLTGPVGDAVNAFVSLLGGTILSGKIYLPQDVVLAVKNLTTAYLAGWNTVVTNVPGVTYWSYSGTNVVNVSLDPTDALMFVTSLVDSTPNDGLVSRTSASWGVAKNLNLNANHLDEVNQLLGSTGVFDAKSFFRGVASELKSKGF